MDSFELGARRGARGEPVPALGLPGVIEACEHGFEPPGPLRVMTPRIMLLETRIRRYQKHAISVPRGGRLPGLEPDQ